MPVFFGTKYAVNKLSSTIRAKMLKFSTCTIFVVIIFSVFSIGDVPTQEIVILRPDTSKVAYDQGKLFIVSISKNSDSTLMASTQWETTRYFVLSDTVKQAFPKEFFQMFAPGTTIQRIVYTYGFFNYIANPETLTFTYRDTVTIRKFWGTPQFSSFIKGLNSTEAKNMVFTVRGWKDSSYTTAYDDPNADNRALYKLQLHLIPGDNFVYLAPNGNKNAAVEYETQLVNESKPLDTRENRFHNSELEKSCSTCHDGLPSADSGRSMKADCSVCHKAIGIGSTIHSPVEMKECSSCHEWSAEKNSMEVVNGIPDACFTCHDDIKATIDSAQVQHPVASDCLTCHSPHASSQGPHLLKKDVYSLCIGCHEDKNINHPVGKHPVRFARTKTGEEVSCLSCHTPHGSKNPHLLLVGGNLMTICAQCH